MDLFNQLRGQSGAALGGGLGQGLLHNRATSAEVYRRMMGHQPGQPIPLPQPEPKMEKPFTDEELKAGRAQEIREVRTPAPGATVEVGFILTDTVLVVNKLVEAVRLLQEENEALKARLKFHVETPEVPFKLPAIAGEYEEDLDNNSTLDDN